MRPILFFCMPEYGHVQRMLHLVESVAGAGLVPVVFTAAAFEQEVRRRGGHFMDLFNEWTIERADAESRPIPCRFVSFAAFAAEDVTRRARALNPAVVVSDTFAVIGRVVARALAVPHVNLCAGHNVVAEEFITRLRSDPRVRIGPRCLEAVSILKSRYGLADASPLCYVAAASPELNVCCEPPAFVDPATRAALEPLVYFGSLPSAVLQGGEDVDRRDRPPTGAVTVYVSFGTVVWRYYQERAEQTLAVLIDYLHRQPGVAVVCSLGGHAAAARPMAALMRSGVRVEPYVDQWATLAGADLFVTHHGMNSTHEAIYHRVPMLSYPFFWDQPALARRCRQLGVATPLGSLSEPPVSARQVEEAWWSFIDRRPRISSALREVRRWELEVVAQRPAVVRRIADIAGIATPELGRPVLAQGAWT